MLQPARGDEHPSSRSQTERGRELFLHKWKPHDPLCRAGDGLGPLFNERSCAACHSQGGPGGAGPLARNVQLLTAVRSGANPDLLARDIQTIHPAFRDAASIVLHRYGVDAHYDPWRHQVVDTVKDAIAGKIFVQAPNLFASKDSDASTTFAKFAPAQRNTPPLFGAGLIDRIPGAVIEAVAREQEAQTPDVKGRPAYVAGHRVGRFGWKAQVGTLDEFVSSACAGELGLEVPGHHQALDPLAPEAKAPGLDLSADDCQALAQYVRALPAPVATKPHNARMAKLINQGEVVFHQVGCAGCHRETLGDVQGLYSDLLLHGMGLKLSDSGSYYGEEKDKRSPGEISLATPGEWRTPPLWGLRDSAPYLHDGRAQTIEQAIEAHDDQAEASRKLYNEATPLEREALHYFLDSLAAPRQASSGARGT